MFGTLLISAVLAAPPAADLKADFAVEQAAREFRITVYGRFHTLRDEFDARRGLGDELLKTWNRAEQPPAHRTAVIAWFNEAGRLSQSGQPLLPYAQLGEMRSVEIDVELPDGVTQFDPVSGHDDSKGPVIPPPLTLDDMPPAESPAPAKSLLERMKSTFFGSKSKEIPAPAAAK